MVMRSTTLQVDLAKVEEVMRLIETSVVPASQRERGFKQFMVVADRAKGRSGRNGRWTINGENMAQPLLSTTLGLRTEPLGKEIMMEDLAVVVWSVLLFVLAHVPVLIGLRAYRRSQ